MKKIITIVSLLFTSVCVDAQLIEVPESDTLYVYQEGEIIFKKAISEIDSIKFEHNYPIIDRTVVDIDDNEYEYITVDGVDWFTSNLKTTRLNDGTVIVEGPWAASIPSFIKPSNSIHTFYNYHVVASNKLCPVDWEVPSRNDFLNMIGRIIPGIAFPSMDEMSAEGMDFLASGYVLSGGVFASSTAAYFGFWNAEQESTDEGRHIYSTAPTSTLFTGSTAKDNGLTVRCIRKP